MAKTLGHLMRYYLGLEPASSQTSEAERNALALYAAGRRSLSGDRCVRRTDNLGVGEVDGSGEGVLYAIDPFLAGRLGICWSR